MPSADDLRALLRVVYEPYPAPVVHPADWLMWCVALNEPEPDWTIDYRLTYRRERKRYEPVDPRAREIWEKYCGINKDSP